MRKVFLSSALMPLAVSLVTLQSARGSTPGTIAKFDAAGNPTADSVITEDPAGNLGVGTPMPSPMVKLDVNGGTNFALVGRSSVVSAVWGETTGITGGADGVHGVAHGSGSGVAGVNTDANGVGVWGQNTAGGVAVYGTSQGIGLYGTSSGDVGVFGNSSISAGVYGTTNNPFAVGVLARSAGFSDTNPGLEVVGTARVSGMLSAKVVQITGADFSEKFEVRETKGRREPGMVVAIDPENPGQLVLSTTAYNRRVAGILSGAGGINPGMLMGQPGTLADGDHPVALSGRVYVWADASNGPIVPGDLLTTSNKPGHAMKVTDYRKAQGATIGKAMTELRQGRGLVLTLVTLQ